MRFNISLSVGGNHFWQLPPIGYIVPRLPWTQWLIWTFEWTLNELLKVHTGQQARCTGKTSKVGQRRCGVERKKKQYEKRRRAREFQPSWAHDRPWLQLTLDNKTMFCTYCRNVFENVINHMAPVNLPRVHQTSGPAQSQTMKRLTDTDR